MKEVTSYEGKNKKRMEEGGKKRGRDKRAKERKDARERG